MDITSEKLQFFLESAWVAAPAAANSLRDQMFQYESQVRNISRGGTLGSVSKNSASQSYRGPGLGTYTPDQLGDGWRMLINLYDSVLEWIQWAIANPPTNPPAWWPVVAQDGDYDPQIYPKMVWRLKNFSSGEYQIDLTDLRLHPVMFGRSEVLTW